MTQNSRYLRHLRAIIVVSLPVLMGIGPCSSGPRWLERIPGGALEGDVVAAPVTDWSFVRETGLCQIETRPQFPHSITLNCFNHGSELYVGCMSCEGKAWSAYLSADPEARIRIGDDLYPVTARRVTGASEMQAAWTARIAKLRPDAEVPPVPDGYWLFHLVSRGHSSSGPVP